jgi:hypothetical protein
MVRWKLLHPKMTEFDLGELPRFLSEEDPRPAAKQIDANYQHGGGWCPMRDFVLRDDNSIKYPGDRASKPIAEAKLRDETIFLYLFGFVAIIQPDRRFEVARVD